MYITSSYPRSTIVDKYFVVLRAQAYNSVCSLKGPRSTIVDTLFCKLCGPANFSSPNLMILGEYKSRGVLDYIHPICSSKFSFRVCVFSCQKRSSIVDPGFLSIHNFLFIYFLKIIIITLFS